MFGNYTQEPQAKPQDCRPDPEDMLQNARKRRLKVQADIDAFMEFENYRFGNDNDHLLALLGVMHLFLYEAKKAEQHWLDEIDKD